MPIKKIEMRRNASIDRSLWNWVNLFILICIFVRPDWLLVRSKLASGLTNDLPIGKNYLQACSGKVWKKFIGNFYFGRITLNLWFNLKPLWWVTKFKVLFSLFQSFRSLNFQTRIFTQGCCHFWWVLNFITHHSYSVPEHKAISDTSNNSNPNHLIWSPR